MKTESRFGHTEGITDLCILNHSGDKEFVTCGSDGDVRIWKGFMDEDPTAFSASDACLSLVCRGTNLYVGTENHTVELYELPSGKRLGVKAKFTATVNHLDVSKDQKILIAGSGDTTIQLVSLEDSATTPKKIDAHSGPILSISIDPMQEYFASSACDGNVNIWTLSLTGPRIIKTWENMFPTSTDITLSSTLCRMDWSPAKGLHIAIPESSMQVTTYTRDSWTKVQVYECSGLTKMVSVVKYSDCGKYLAGGAQDGRVVVWNIDNATVILQTAESTQRITGVALSTINEMALYSVDYRGKFYWYGDFQKSANSNNIKPLQNKPAPVKVINENSKDSLPDEDDEDVFDDGMEDIFGDGIDNIDNENEISISKIKAEVGFIDDEYVGVDRAIRKTQNGDDDDIQSIGSQDGMESVHSSRPTTVSAPPINYFTKPQDAFQPSSSPVHLEHRFMVWNNIGIMRSYSVDEDDAIDIEFHDASHHPPIHLRNQFDFTMGTLTVKAAVLACEEDKHHPSKLFCVNYGTWDSTKEWTIDMPKNEDILAIAAGPNWIVAGTNHNRLRLFSVGGVQYLVYDLPGTVVALSAFEDLLFVTYHYGVGVRENQSVSYSLFRVNHYKLRCLVATLPLPLTPKSMLSWIGFSDEGTPCYTDTKDTLRILNGQTWIPFCDMRELLSGPNDHFWVVGVSEAGQNIRSVKCKGSKYPPALPRPTLLMIDAKIPVCELDSEKSQMEDKVLRSMLLASLSSKLEKKGQDTEEWKDEADKYLRESLMKLYVLSCKGNRDLRASEYISMMPSSHAVQIAVKYASKLHKVALTDRLIKIGKEKMEVTSDDEGDDFESNKTIITAYKYLSSGENSGGSSAREEQDVYIDQVSMNGPRRSISEVAENPLIKRQKQEIRDLLSPSNLKKNPFKKNDTQETDNSQNDSQGKGLALIDTWKKPTEKTALPEFNLKHSLTKKTNRKTDKGDKEPKNGSTKLKGKKQPTLFDMKNKRKLDENPGSPSIEVDWEDCNLGSPEVEQELTEPIGRDIDSPNEDSPSSGRTKRKRETEDDDFENTIDSDKKSRFATKLSAFKKA